MRSRALPFVLAMLLSASATRRRCGNPTTAAAGYGREHDLVPGRRADHLERRLYYPAGAAAGLQPLPDGTFRFLSRHSALHRHHARALQYRVRPAERRADAAVRAPAHRRAGRDDGQPRAVAADRHRRRRACAGVIAAGRRARRTSRVPTTWRLVDEPAPRRCRAVLEAGVPSGRCRLPVRRHRAVRDAATRCGR